MSTSAWRPANTCLASPYSMSPSTDFSSPELGMLNSPFVHHNSSAFDHSLPQHASYSLYQSPQSQTDSVSSSPGPADFEPRLISGPSLLHPRSECSDASLASSPPNILPTTESFHHVVPASCIPSSDANHYSQHQLSQHPTSSAFQHFSRHNELGTPLIHTADPCYAKLLFNCLAEAPGHERSLRDIYNWIELHSRKAADPANRGWRNSVRHNLSMNAAFHRITSTTNTGRNTSVWRLTSTALAKGGVLSTTKYRKTPSYSRRGRRETRTSTPDPSRAASGAKGGIASRKAAQLRNSLKQAKSRDPYSTPSPCRRSTSVAAQSNSSPFAGSPVHDSPSSSADPASQSPSASDSAATISWPSQYIWHSHPSQDDTDLSGKPRTLSMALFRASEPINAIDPASDSQVTDPRLLFANSTSGLYSSSTMSPSSPGLASMLNPIRHDLTLTSEPEAGYVL